jgi:hypothetical protein
MQNDETDICEKTYYEVRIGNAMLVLILITNILILSMGLLGFLYWLDNATPTK